MCQADAGSVFALGRGDQVMLKNKEGYSDPTTAAAIQEADRPPEHVRWFIWTVKALADLVDLEVAGRIKVRDKKTKRVWE